MAPWSHRVPPKARRVFLRFELITRLGQPTVGLRGDAQAPAFQHQCLNLGRNGAGAIIQTFIKHRQSNFGSTLADRVQNLTQPLPLMGTRHAAGLQQRVYLLCQVLPVGTGQIKVVDGTGACTLCD